MELYVIHYKRTVVKDIFQFKSPFDYVHCSGCIPLITADVQYLPFVFQMLPLLNLQNFLSKSVKNFNVGALEMDSLKSDRKILPTQSLSWFKSCCSW